MFSLDEFVVNPAGKLSTIVAAKKSDLINVAARLEIAINARDRKSVIQNTILEHLIDEGIISEVEGRKYMLEIPESNVEWMKLAFELESLKIAKI